MSFEGRSAVVTGAGGGMGLNVARDLLAAGANVTCADLKEKPAGLDAGPGRSLYLRGDLTDPAFVAEVFTRTRAAAGRLDYLVNAAAVLWFGRDASLVDMDLEVWDRVIDIDLRAVMLTARHAVPLMRAGGGGAIVNLASIAGIRGNQRMVAYSASKGGIVAFTMAAALDHAGDNIRINCVCPGSIDTDMVQSLIRSANDPEAMRAAAIARHPIGRIAEAEEVAAVIAFLASGDASFQTGLAIPVDGGRSIR